MTEVPDFDRLRVTVILVGGKIPARHDVCARNPFAVSSPCVAVGNRDGEQRGTWLEVDDVVHGTRYTDEG